VCRAACLTVVSLAGVFVFSFWWWMQLVLVLVGLSGIAFLVNSFGLYMRSHGQTPFDFERLCAEGGKFARTRDDRLVEYWSYGSEDYTARVLISLHCSGMTARVEALQQGPICSSLGLRGIAISWGAHGYTDMKPGRRIMDWPHEDLAAVLDAELVQTFMVTGCSAGSSAHALAAAWAFPARCEAVGLAGVGLPDTICRESGLPRPRGGRGPAAATLGQWWMGWCFALRGLVVFCGAGRGMRCVRQVGESVFTCIVEVGGNVR